MTTGPLVGTVISLSLPARLVGERVAFDERCHEIRSPAIAEDIRNGERVLMKGANSLVQFDQRLKNG